MTANQNESTSVGQAPPESGAAIIQRLMVFYNVDTIDALIRAQERHIHKLQTEGPPRLGDERFLRTPREG